MKTVIIAGTGAGIGAATAVRLAAGWDVVVTGRRKGFLDLSDEPAWMTGAVIPLDGGQTLDIR